MLAWERCPVSALTAGILRIDIEGPYLALYAVVSIGVTVGAVTVLELASIAH